MKTLFLIISVMFAFSIIAQDRVPVPANIRNISKKRPFQNALDNSMNSNQNIPVPQLVPSKILVEGYAEIGQTHYDLQSNASVDHRMYIWPDGTIGTTYNFGQVPTAFDDRGTGYQYFDGTTWIDPFPATRIETVRTGWGSYSHLGLSNEGEVVVAHNGTTLIVNTRPAKGTGPWTESIYPAANGADPTWPRICTNGNSIHVLSASNNAWNGQSNPIWYSRSQDAGVTWDIQNITPLGLRPVDGYTKGFGGDVYDWAEPRNNTLAFLIGGNWTDLIMMKSTDNGNTWTKTVIFQHPFPNFNETTDLIGDGVMSTDTPYVCDGAHSIVLDANGSAYVVFGIMRVSNTSITDDSTDYFPFTDGIAIWKEGEPTLTDLNPDVLYDAGKLAAWAADRSGDGTLFENFESGITDVPDYYLSLSSMPQLSIDDNNTVFLLYKGVCEDMLSPDNKYYSHIWGTYGYQYLGWWNFNPIQEITGGTDFDGTELIYPCMSQVQNPLYSGLYFTTQMDAEPGLAVRGETGYSYNSIMLFELNFCDEFTPPCNGVKKINLSGDFVIFPNPVTDYMNVYFDTYKSTNGNLKVYNAIGSLVDSKEIVFNKSETQTINTSNLAKGIYLMKFETAEGTFTRKFVK